MLRDPIDRVISHYYHVINRPKHYLYKAVTSRNMNLAEYVRSGLSHEANNGQVRQISGVEAVFFDREPVSPGVLDVAKRNLSEHFHGVGLLERYDESLILFKKLLG